MQNTSIDRFNKYIQSIGQEKTHIHGEDNKSIEPNNTHRCRKCNHPATHISSELGKEQALCDECSKKFLKKRVLLPIDIYFCLPVHQVVEIDKIKLKHKTTLDEETANQLLAQFLPKISGHGKNELKEMLENKNDIVVLNVFIGGHHCYQPVIEKMVSINLDEFCLIHDISASDEIAKDLNDQWKDGSVLMIFFNNHEESILNFMCPIQKLISIMSH
jgi:hypothetical protein